MSTYPAPSYPAASSYSPQSEYPPAQHAGCAGGTGGAIPASGFPPVPAAAYPVPGSVVASSVVPTGPYPIVVLGGGKGCDCGHLRLEDYTEQAPPHALAGVIPPQDWARAVQAVNEVLRTHGLTGWWTMGPLFVGLAILIPLTIVLQFTLPEMGIAGLLLVRVSTCCCCCCHISYESQLGGVGWGKTGGREQGKNLL